MELFTGLLGLGLVHVEQLHGNLIVAGMPEHHRYSGRKMTGAVIDPSGNFLCFQNGDDTLQQTGRPITVSVHAHTDGSSTHAETRVVANENLSLVVPSWSALRAA